MPIANPENPKLIEQPNKQVAQQNTNTSTVLQQRGGGPLPNQTTASPSQPITSPYVNPAIINPAVKPATAPTPAPKTTTAPKANNPVVNAVETVGKDVLSDIVAPAAIKTVSTVEADAKAVQEFVAPAVKTGNTINTDVEDILNVAAVVASKSKTPVVSQVTNFEIGASGEILNQENAVSNVALSLFGKKTNPAPFKPQNETQQIGEYGTQVTEIAATAIIAPELLPALSPTAILAMGGIGVGITEGFGAVGIGKVTTNPNDILNDFLASELFYVAGQGLVQGLGSVAGTTGSATLRNTLTFFVGTKPGRIALFTGFGAGVGYFTGGVKGAEIGAAMGFGFSALGEYVGTPLMGKLKLNVPDWLGGATKLTESTPEIGTDELELSKTWVSNPIDALEGKQIRVIGDVTLNPDDAAALANEYVGKIVPTAHATLNPEDFSLEKGDVTLLKGFPSEGAGFRASLELFHFYSAPGDEQFINIYGGYMGVGETEEGEIPRLVVGGKPTALVTTGTEISDFAPLKGESLEDYATRISNMSGKTGIPPENYQGASIERQFITPASYELEGKELPGSNFVSEGKVGKFGIEEYQGALQDIPVLRDLTARYTFFDVYKGEYTPTEDLVEQTNKILNVTKYNESYVPTRSIPSLPIGFGSLGLDLSLPSSRGKTSLPSSTISRLSNMVTGSQRSRGKSNASNLSKGLSNFISNVPSTSSTPSKNDPLSIPSKPSKPSTPSYPSMPSDPFSPSPSNKSTPSSPSSNISISQYYYVPSNPLNTQTKHKKTKSKLEPYLSERKIYPILSGEDILKLDIPIAQNSKTSKNRKISDRDLAY